MFEGVYESQIPGEHLFDLPDGAARDLLSLGDRFNPAPASLVAAFQRNEEDAFAEDDLEVDHRTAIVVVEKEHKQWRFVSYVDFSPDAWRLVAAEPKAKAAEKHKLGRRARRKRKEHEAELDLADPLVPTIGVYSLTESGRSPVVWDYEVFEGVWGVPEPEEEEARAEDEVELVTGHDRCRLAAEDDRTAGSDFAVSRQRRWDYFFRPIEDLVGLDQQLDAWWAKDEADDARAWARSRARAGLAWLFLAVGIAVAAAAAQPALALIAVLPIVAAGKALVERRSEITKAEHLESIQAQRKGEVAALHSQLPAGHPSDAEIDSALDSDLHAYERRAIEELGLDEAKMLKLEPEVTRPSAAHGNFESIVIDDWAMLQDPATPGLHTIEFDHLTALPIIGEVDQVPRYAVRFVHFVFPTEQQLAVYGFFYDFIAGEEHGVATDEYFYSNVVSVGTRRDVSPLADPTSRDEDTMSFILTVASGDSVRVAVTDAEGMKRLNESLNERSRKLRESKRSDVSRRKPKRSDASDKKEKEKEKKRGQVKRAPRTDVERVRHLFRDGRAERVIAVDEEMLPAARAHRAIAYIRRELRARA